MTTDGAVPRRGSSVRTRVISAVVLGVVMLALTWLGGLWFRVCSAAVAALMLYEWLTISGAAANRLHFAVLWLAMSLFAVALILGMEPVVVLAVVVLGVAASLASGYGTGEGGTGSLGLAYSCVSGFALAALRGDTAAGLGLILFLFAVVWSTDIFAFFVGRAMGGPKLAPAISPGKTWSGAVGGTVFAVAAAAIYSMATGVPLLTCVLAAIVLSVISQIGDLAESAAKRRFGVKDSGWIIPGHGGVMDRVDGLVAAAMALYVIVVLLAASGMGSLSFPTS